MRGDDVHVLLEEATTEIPPSTVNVSEAVRTAKHRRRVRRVTLCITAGVLPAVVAVSLMTGITLSTYRIKAASQGPASGSGVAADVSASTDDGNIERSAIAGAAITMRALNPMSRYLSITWLPSSVIEERWESTPLRQQYTGFESERRDRGVTVTVLARGQRFSEHEPVLGLKGLTTRVARPVAGAPAVCLSAPGDDASCPVLRWEYEPESWMSVSYTTRRELSSTTIAKVTRQVAESVSIDRPESVKLPFWVGGNTATFTPTRVVVQERKRAVGGSGARWSARLVLDSGSGTSTMTGGAGVTVEVTDVVQATSSSNRDRTPNTTVRGEAVWLSQDRNTLVALDGGTKVTVQVADARADAVFEDLCLVGSPDDSDLWTDVPFT